MKCTCSGKIIAIFNVADQETAKRILEEMESVIRERVKTASEPKGRVLRYETSYWDAAPNDEK